MRNLILLGIFALFFTLTILLVGGQKKRPTYRSTTTKDMLEHYTQKSLEDMISALKHAKISGMIEESLRCPCYDVTVSTKSNHAILRINRGGCSEKN